MEYIKIIVNSDNENPALIKRMKAISSLNDICIDKIVLPKAKISSTYGKQRNTSLSNILEISPVNHYESVFRKNYLQVMNKSSSCNSLLNFNNETKSIYRKMYNEFLSFHNIINK